MKAGLAVAVVEEQVVVAERGPQGQNEMETETGWGEKEQERTLLGLAETAVVDAEKERFQNTHPQTVLV